MNAAQLINATSGEVEYFTPLEIIEAARATMGRISLDPASSALANHRVKATGYLDHNRNALVQEWGGCVWMNHPYGRAETACAPDCNRREKSPRHVCHSFDLYGNAAWIDKLISEYYSARVHQACCITFSSTSEAWFQPLLNFPQCFLSPRTNYLLPDGTIKRGVTKGSVVTYLGPNIDRFADSFAHLGIVKVAYHSK